MKKLFTLILVFFLYSAQATTYYFSAVSGDDSRSSAQAANASTPWKTLGKLNSFFSSLLAGDSVLLKRGETFFGSITVSKSGSSVLPIVIAAYGTGSKPVITSLVTISNWVSKGNGVWESYNSFFGESLNTVIINNVSQEMGRYPNSNVANKGYLTFESHTSNSITDNELNASPVWTGAEVVIRTDRWLTSKFQIINHSGNTITCASPPSSLHNNFGYFIQDDIKTLDKFGEWYYNPSVKKLSIYFGANTPSSYVIQAPAIDNLISASNYKNVVFDNLNVKGANTNGFNIREGANMAVKNCDISFSGVNGASVYFHPHFTLENCTIANSNVNGINFGYSGDYAVIRNNKITNTAIFAGMGGNGEGKGNGIFNNGKNSVIEYNEVINTGFIGINFNGDSTLVKNNLVDTFCMTKDDGGGIYTYLGSASPHTGSKVIGNIVLNGMGAGEGGGSDAAPQAQGIYLDNNSENIEIRDNTVANGNGLGIYLHRANNVLIKNNTVYNNDKQFLTNQDNNVNVIRNCTLTGNNFFAKSPGQDILALRSVGNDIGSIGRFDSNYYNRPFAEWFIIATSYSDDGSRVNGSYDLEEWKNEYQKDITTKRAVKQFMPYRLNSLIGSNKFANGSFSAAKTGLFPYNCTVTLGNSGQLDGSYVEIAPSSSSSSVFMNVGELKAGVKYLLKFSIKGSVSNSMNISGALRKGVSPYTTVTPLQYRKVGASRSDNEMLFSSTTNEAAAQIVFKIDDQNKYYLDNVQLYEADATITDIDDSVRFEYNATRVSKTISLPGTYVDVKNNKYSNSIVLQPYTSAILLRNGGSANVAPSVSITSPSDDAAVAAPASVTITAAAADTDGSISKVEFYNGDTLLATAAQSPYTFTWKNVAAGSYSITAKATDNGSLVTSSAAVNISVYKPNVAPSVSITGPADSAAFAAPASVTITADAADTDGSISKVDFYNGGTLLGTVTESPYTFTWNSVAAGNYFITAKATDNGSLVTSSAAVAISVYTPNTAPSVSLTSPENDTKYVGPATVTISAAASDMDGTVSKVEFYNGAVLLKTILTSPYTYSWAKVAAGNYSLTAKATDDKGLVTTSAAVNITVLQNKAPSVVITTPAANATYNSPATIDMSASASDADGTISRVDFYNGTTLLRTERYAPYTYTWQNVAAGTYKIVAKATDDKGAVTTSASVTVTVQNAGLRSVNNTAIVTNKVYAFSTAMPAVSKADSKMIEVKVFPNPVANKIYIHTKGLLPLNQKATINIQNVSGIVVKSMLVIISGKTIEADVSSLLPGIYFIKIINNDFVITRKFIKD